MEEVTLYKAVINGTLVIQAVNLDKALDKAREWVEENSSKLTITFETIAGYIEGGEE